MNNSPTQRHSHPQIQERAANTPVLKPSRAQLAENSLLRHGADSRVGPIVRCRRRLGNYTAEEFYECTLANLVGRDTRWLDVGCGRDLLPMNVPLARSLSQRCGELVGIDPDPNVLENTFVHQSHHAGIEDYRSAEPFDLITLRMVVEHISSPDDCVKALKRNCKPGGYLVVYTPHKYSLSSLASALVPNAAHHFFKRLLWGTEERDTFPTHYRMNTLRALRKAFLENGFAESALWKLDDAALLHSMGFFGKLELWTWAMLHKLRLPYPEKNILGVFQRV